MTTPPFLPPGKMAAVRGEVPSFDGLRGINVIIVMCSHGLLGPYSEVVPGGLAGYVFFVISGFLITRLIFIEHKTTGTVSLSLFYLRRIIRLYPAVIVFSAIFIGIYLWLGRPVNWMEPISALAYFNNYHMIYLADNHLPFTMPPFNVFWSLSLEEHFYVLFPIVFLLARGRPARLLGLMVAICAFCLAWRLLMRWEHPEISLQAFYALTQYRIDSIAFGVALALLCEMPRGRMLVARLSGPLPFACGAVLLAACLVIRNPWFRDTLRYSAEGVAITLLVSGVLFDGRHRISQWLLNLKWLKWFGRMSYSMYVWHEGIFYLSPVGGLAWWQQSVINLAGTLVVTMLSYHLVEMPVHSLRRYLHPRGSLPAPRVGAGGSVAMASGGSGHDV